MLRSLINSTSLLNPSSQKFWSLLDTQSRAAARKGTRIKRQLENRKRARQRAIEAKLAPPKPKWIPPHLKVKLDSSTMQIGGHRSMDEKLKEPPPDNVYFTSEYRPVTYDLSEIIDMYRVTHDKSMLDHENAVVLANCELDLRTAKKTKFVQDFEGLLHELPHDLALGERRIIVAICPDMKVQEEAIAAGASITGGKELIREIQKGRLKVDSFDELIVHSSMLIDLAPLRGILRHHFPTKTKGNYGSDMGQLVSKFIAGVEYHMKRDDFDPSHGKMNFPFARLNWEFKKIKENLEIALSTIETNHQPPNPLEGVQFIRKVWISCKSESDERLLTKHWELDCFKGRYTDPWSTKKDESVQQASPPTEDQEKEVASG